MICQFLVITAALAQAAPPEADTSPVATELSLSSEVVWLGDPLFARVKVYNVSDEELGIPRVAFLTSGYRLSSWKCPFEYRFSSEDVRGDFRAPFVLAAGESCILDDEVLEFPPTHEFDHDFWRDAVGKRWKLSTRNNGGASTKLDFGAECTYSVLIKDRSKEEMIFLQKLFSEWERRIEERTYDRTGLDEFSPIVFGLNSYPSDPDLVEKLIAFEERLSPGTLRDVVHLVGVLRKLHGSDDSDSQAAIVLNLLRWFDGLPEIERQILALKTLNAIASLAGGDPRFDALYHGVALRVPSTMYGTECYRAARLRGYADSHSGFRQYLDEREMPEADSEK